MYDNATTNLLEHTQSIISFISNGLHYGSVLVHCQRGVSRSTTCVLFFLMNRVGMDFESAFRLIKSQRDCADPIPAFITQAKKYEGQCKKLGLIKDDLDCDGGEILSKKRKAAGPKRLLGPSPQSAAVNDVLEIEKDGEDGKSKNDSTTSLISRKKQKVEQKKKRNIGPSLPPHLSK